MDIDDVLRLVLSWDGTLALTPGPGDDAPEIAWGDTFFYYAPDGVVPARGQPFATIVTTDQPGDRTSRLDRAGVFRVDIGAGREAARRVAEAEDQADPAALDRVVVHPVYGSLGWLAVLNPGSRTAETTRALLREAYEAARGRASRREQHSAPPEASAPLEASAPPEAEG